MAFLIFFSFAILVSAAMFRFNIKRPAWILPWLIVILSGLFFLKKYNISTSKEILLYLTIFSLIGFFIKDIIFSNFRKIINLTFLFFIFVCLVGLTIYVFAGKNILLQSLKIASGALIFSMLFYFVFSRK